MPSSRSAAGNWSLPSLGDGVVILEVPGPTSTPAGALTPAEAEVVALIALGSSNAEIARSRGTSTRTVANQVSRLLARLGVASRHDLVVWALGRAE